MSYHSLIKDHAQEAQLFKRRAWVAAIVSLLLIMLLIARLIYLQLYEYSRFKSLSENNRIRITSIVPNRGLIYDRNGVIMAENQPSYRLEIIPEQVKDIEAMISGLSELVQLDERSLKRFRRAMKRSRSFNGVPLRTKLSDDEVARLAVNRHRFPGMEITAALSRHYPLGKSAVHVVGYVGRIDENELKRVDAVNYAGTSHIGKVGLERYYESQLHGNVGHQSIEVNVQGRVVRVLDRTPPVPGKDLLLSIDAQVQKVAEDAMGSNRGAVVAMIPKTGEIVAMASMPSYDPNLFVHGISYKDYKRLRDSSDKPLLNRAIMGQYPPGSTTKPFVGLAGLVNSVIGRHEDILCEGFYLLPNEERKYRDWKKTGHGFVDLSAAVEESCDVYFYELSYRLGINRMYDFLRHFGFGRKTGIDTGGERPGLLPSREWKKRVKGQAWFPGETLIAGIGQGYVLSTPLQLAAATSALAMRGTLMKPHLVKALRDSSSGLETEIKAVKSDEIKLQRLQNWDTVVNSMVKVVHGLRGTARSLSAGLDKKMAGKTGTAQVFGIAQDEEYDEENTALRLRDHALFVSFYPVKNPQIAVAVIVENGGHGGRVAAPIAGKVTQAWMKKINDE